MCSSIFDKITQNLLLNVLFSIYIEILSCLGGGLKENRTPQVRCHPEGQTVIQCRLCVDQMCRDVGSNEGLGRGRALSGHRNRSCSLAGTRSLHHLLGLFLPHAALSHRLEQSEDREREIAITDLADFSA